MTTTTMEEINGRSESRAKKFCGNHSSEQLDEIEDKRKIFHKMLTEYKSNSQKHPLVQQINQWESDATEKIRRTADECRVLIFEYINEIEMKFNQFTQQFEQIQREENDVNEMALNQLKETLIRLENELRRPAKISIEDDESLLIPSITVERCYNPSGPPIWEQNGITIAGGNGQGGGLDQFYCPMNVYVDDDQTIYVADYCNHRIIEWKKDTTFGRVVAGGNGPGSRNDQLHHPTHVIVDKENDRLLICDSSNQRVVQWPCQNGTSGQTIISKIKCCGLAMDNQGYIYVSDLNKHEVRRWKSGERNGIVVAGGNGQGNRLDQLNNPCYIFVDQDQAVYVSDASNHRVIKWTKDAREGIVVAGGGEGGGGITQLYNPHGVIVDHSDTIYVADASNHRVMKWLKGAREGCVVVGENGEGHRANQFKSPIGLSFDQHNNLYVVDMNNHRVQKFSIDAQHS